MESNVKATLKAISRMMLANAGDTPDRWGVDYVCNLFLTILCAVTLILFVIATVKATKLVWPQEKMIPTMLVFLCLSLFGSFAYFLWTLLRTYKYPFKSTVPVGPVYPEEACELSVFPFLPAVFLAVAVILNIDKWLYFYFRIMVEYRCLKNKQIRNLEMIDLDNKKKWLNIVAISIIVMYESYMLGYQIFGCTHNFT